ncbi:MAG TPA: methyltransferase domain-containing protein [Candidatus Binatia bacterium]|jgi:SAM-dependent methyltransferase|nr:methyltransferase domain-containing protein [Candidatus Binatia bacterium]
MRPEPLIATQCAVCGNHTFAVICPAHEVRSHLEYLWGFHCRRSRPRRDHEPARDGLAERAGFTQDYVTDIVACTGCGLVFRNPHPSAQAPANAYPQGHYGSARLAALFEAQRELSRRQARFLRRWLPTREEIRIVEVGSFVGGFLAAGQEYGWNMVGVEPEMEVNNFCRRRGQSVFQGTLTELPLEERSVDCIAIWQTFDQLPDPEPTLAAACRLLRPGGILAVRVPNGECFRLAIAWMRKLPRPLASCLRVALAWNNLLAFPYLHGYSLRTLDWLLPHYGFTRIAVRPDTLPRLAGAQTKRWAAQEERTLKFLCSLTTRLAALHPTNPGQIAPWFDVCYRQSLRPAITRVPRFKVSLPFPLLPAVA